ncbi:MAG: hypothetical protein DRJ44_03440 [Thermoprotei archaeon]|nr:MAG: hypothetical protein DRJ44_03440 [Thermoprotei archaeon]
MIERIFRAYDVRGVYGKELNEEIAEKIGYATAIVAESEELVVGRDTRYHSPSLTQALIKGINEAGCNVIFVGANPNPLVYYACWSMRKPGIYATASVDGSEYTLVKDVKSNRILLVKVGDFIQKFIDKKENLKNFAVISFNPENGKISFKRIKDVFVHKINEPLYELKLRYGKSVKVTASHSVYVYRNNKLICIPTSDLKVGDLVATASVIPNITSIPKFNLAKELWPYRNELRTIILSGPDILKIRMKRISSKRKKCIRLKKEGRQLLMKIRKERGLSRSKVAKMIGISSMTIQRIELERSRKFVKEDLIRKYVQKLGLNVDEFLEKYTLEEKRFKGRWIDGRTLNNIKLNDLTKGEVEKIKNCKLYGKGYPQNSIPNIIELTPEFMRLIGYYIAEGNLECRDRVCFTLGHGGHERFIIDDIISCSQKCFNIKPKIYKIKGNRTKVVIDNVVIFGIFSKILGFENKNSNTKKLPDFVYTLPLELKINLLKGVFLGDGTLSRGIRFNTTSKELAVGISYLLTQLGVLHSFREEPSKRKNRNTIYIISITRKQELKKIEDVWKDHWKSKSLFSQYKGRKNKYLRIGDLILLPIKEIKKVKPSSSYVYDFSVEGETFIAGIGGICCHNSHNPPEYGGFKFIRCDGTSFIEEYRKIKEIVLSGKFEKSEKLGSVKEENVLESYLKTVSRHVRVEGKVKIVAETFGGAVNLVLPKILNTFNIELKVLHPQIKGDFYGLRPEPKGENLRELRKRVVKEGADFGVAFDGDADRAVFVDDKGRELSGSLAGIVFTKYLTKKGDTIVLTYDTSTALREVAENKGLKIVWSRVGHGFIEEKVRDHGAVLGIEQSSHFYFGFLYPFSDGVLSTLLMTSIVSQGVKISEALEKVKARPMEKIYINAVNDHIKKKVIKKIEEMYPSAEKLEDGVKIYFGDEWVIVRESQTMPEVNLVVEAENEERLEELISEYKKLIKKLVEKMSK